MAGVGMTPEAIEHNPVVYDLMVSSIAILKSVFKQLAIKYLVILIQLSFFACI